MTNSALDIYNTTAEQAREAIDIADKSMLQQRLRTHKDFPEGTTRLRVIPPTRAAIELAAQRGTVPEVFFEFHRHLYEIGGKGSGNWAAFACPHKNLKIYGGRGECVDCAKGRRLRQINERDSAAWKAGLELGADHLRIFLVIDRDKPELGIHPLGISAPVGKKKGRSAYEQLTAVLNDPDMGGDYLHPVHGRDIICKKTVAPGASKREGTSYAWMLAPSATPLHEDVSTMIEMIESQPSIPELIRQEVELGKQRHDEIHGLDGPVQVAVSGSSASALPAAPAAPAAAVAGADADLYEGQANTNSAIEF